MGSVAIVGKPNVGKSTLFNRIIEQRKSIVDDQSGVTRDRIYATAKWLTKEFEIIDTGGVSNQNQPFQKQINDQVEFAIDESEIIIFLTSLKDGVTSDDLLISKKLKKARKNKKVFVVVNKAENINSSTTQNLFYNLGFGEPIFISAEHGIGVGNLLDLIINNLTFKKPADNDNLTFCIIGKPNVGKSSLTNAILNKEQVIVSDLVGTTRDSIDIDFNYNKKKYTIIDTAGIRRKGKIQTGIEKYSVLRAERAIKKSQVILLVLDGSIDFTEQDEIIGGLASSANIPTIVIVNKIDLINKSDKKFNEIKNIIRHKFKHLFWAPIEFVSALDVKKIHRIFETMETVRKEATKKISTSLLNEVVLKAQMIQQAPIHKGSRVNISYCTQINSQIPSFVLFCNDPKYLHFSYARYIENKIREAFNLKQVPILLYWKNKNSRVRGERNDK